MSHRTEDVIDGSLHARLQFSSQRGFGLRRFQDPHIQRY